MSINCRFAIVSDPHVGLPTTIWNHPQRFHLIEVSIPALEIIFRKLENLELDFLLMPGDLTQHGERVNHSWLQQRLQKLPFPVYVVPGNHDIPHRQGCDTRIAPEEFPYYYQEQGYQDPKVMYYSQEIKPGLQLIGLNSNLFDTQGNQKGQLDQEQLDWLVTSLEQVSDKLVILMIHHNVIEHLPGQSHHPLGRRYMLENAPQLKAILTQFQVKLIITGHLHVQDLAFEKGMWEITTGSIVSFPHPYRILNLKSTNDSTYELTITSDKVKSVPGWDDLLNYSREWMAQRADPFMAKLLQGHPLHLNEENIKPILPKLRYFWADIASGDALFDFSDLPEPVEKYLRQFGALGEDGYPSFIDNHTTLRF